MDQLQLNARIEYESKFTYQPITMFALFLERNKEICSARHSRHSCPRNWNILVFTWSKSEFFRVQIDRHTRRQNHSVTRCKTHPFAGSNWGEAGNNNKQAQLKQASHWHDRGFTPRHAIWSANEGRTDDSVRGDARQWKWDEVVRAKSWRKF